MTNTQTGYPSFDCDPITESVAKQTISTLTFFGFDASSEPHATENSIKLLLDGEFLARVIEGCNSISLIVLFVSFIIAFQGRLAPTFLYVLFGSLFIYLINILRIAVLVVLLQKFPNQQSILHGLLFPLIIYGLVFLLWVVWVNSFSNYKINKNEEVV